ncbi:MAG: class I SAM-dependent methyltransferase [Patescibacteria group bacterium]|jgi:SAM-dependent methyltransferase
MTIWDNIYQKYQQGGEAYATLRPELIPEFLEFINQHDFKERRVLDIACGNGKYLVFLKSLGFQVTGIDSSPTAVEMSKNVLADSEAVKLADMYEYQPAPEYYDLIISIAAIHHGLKEQVAAAIKRICAGLIPGAYAFITLPDNEGSSHWTMMTEHEEVAPGVRVPLSGPEKGLPHSSYTRAEIEAMFADFASLELNLLADRGRWIIIARK